jgi:hypothetical protein
MLLPLPDPTTFNLINMALAAKSDHALVLLLKRLSGSPKQILAHLATAVKSGRIQYADLDAVDASTSADGTMVNLFEALTAPLTPPQTGPKSAVEFLRAALTSEPDITLRCCDVELDVNTSCLKALNPALVWYVEAKLSFQQAQAATSASSSPSTTSSSAVSSSPSSTPIPTTPSSSPTSQSSSSSPSATKQQHASTGALLRQT